MTVGLLVTNSGIYITLGHPCFHIFRMTELVGWLKEFQKEAHNPPTMNQPADQGGLDLCMTSGVQEGLGKVYYTKFSWRTLIQNV